MPKRALSLKREPLAELTTDDLREVVAAAAAPTLAVDCVTQYSNLICHTRGTTCAC